jgi:hypothetical protein
MTSRPAPAPDLWDSANHSRLRALSSADGEPTLEEVDVDLVHELTYSATLKPPLAVGPGPFGNRLVYEVIEGRVEGPRIAGRVLSGGADWIIACADGFGRVDVRAQFQTDDGAAIYVQYHGLLEMNEAVADAMAGKRAGTDFGDQYFRTAPRFETGDERYTWLNQSVFLAEGRLLEGLGVEYRVYRVV